MKNWFIPFVAFLFLGFASNAQSDNLGSLLEEGYTISELENIFQSITLKNQKRWLENKGFTLVKHSPDYRLYHYSKNSAVSLGVYYDRSETNVIEVLFHSSPQKYYMALDGLQKNSSFRKISDEDVTSKSGKGTMTKWAKNGYIYYARTDNWKIGMYKDQSNEGSKTYSGSSQPASSASSGSSSSGVSSAPATPKVYDELSSVENLAAYLNKNLYKAWLSADKIEYKFATLGRISFDNSSLAFIVKNNRLYIKMHLPRNGECDYGIKEELAQVVFGETITSTTYVKENGVEVKKVYDGHKFKFDYSCNGTSYNKIVVQLPEKNFEFWKALRAKLNKN